MVWVGLGSVRVGSGTAILWAPRPSGGTMQEIIFYEPLAGHAICSGWNWTGRGQVDLWISGPRSRALPRTACVQLNNFGKGVGHALILDRESHLGCKVNRGAVRSSRSEGRVVFEGNLIEFC